MPREITPLGRYILALIDLRHYSMRRASIDAGLSESTVSKMIRRGKTGKPTPATLKALADVLDGDFEHMMRLAGHLPSPPKTTLDPKRSLLLERLDRLTPERQERVIDAALLLIEASKIANGVPPLNEEEQASQAEDARPQKGPVTVPDGGLDRHDTKRPSRNSDKARSRTAARGTKGRA